jgi:hypothetical protein
MLGLPGKHVVRRPAMKKIQFQSQVSPTILTILALALALDFILGRTVSK